MRRLCCNKIALVLFTTFYVYAMHLKSTPSVAFYYGKNLSAEFLNRFDWVIVDADVIDPIWVKRYPNKLFAYVSIFEYQPWRYAYMPKGLTKTLGENKHWQTTWMDLRQPEYQEFLLSHMASLYRRGYRHFFLDTLDSPFGKYHDDPHTITALKAALKEIIKNIRSRFPNAKLITNRGIEIMQTLCQNVDAFAIESLYHGIDTQTKSYVDIPNNDRIWIKQQLDHAKACGLLPIVIDYLPQDNQYQRIQAAKQIANNGYIPYITDRFLQHEGIGVEIPQKRRVLLLYDSSRLHNSDPVYDDTHLLFSMPLEYLGYIPVLWDIRNKRLPDPGIDRYAAVIVSPNNLLVNETKFFAWVKQTIDAGQRVIFLNDFGFTITPERANALGLHYQKSLQSSQVFANITKNTFSGEIPPLVINPDVLIDVQEGKRLMIATNHHDQIFTPVAITPWGGYAVYNSAIRKLGDKSLWSIDPFAFFNQAITTQPFPIPDPTTENARRLLFIHIDGDGFTQKAQFAPHTYTSQILYETILQHYQLPHSVSIIEGELTQKHHASNILSIAQHIFRLDNVEAASHSYSHPFHWQQHQNTNHTLTTTYAHHNRLPISGSQLDLGREINKSITYINQNLLPPNKYCRLFFWTGDCLPGQDALRLCEILGIRSINGGDTTAVKTEPWLFRIAPLGLQRGPFWQIYVGAQNENLYTENWQGPFWGYRRVVQTFALTNKPRRLKPINIYYHFYSASKIASLNALKEVYKYALRTDTLPIYTSEYIAIAQDFYTTAITRLHDGGWHIHNQGHLRTLRIPHLLGYPDIQRSSGILGFKDEGKNSYYLHLDSSGDYRLYFQSSIPKQPYLIEANARITQFHKSESKYHFRFKGYTRYYGKFHVPPGWKLTAPPYCHIKKSQNNSFILTSDKRELEVSIVAE